MADGCGRCNYYQTAQCKVHNWITEISLLRSLLLGQELEEEIKWGFPCYTINGKNVAMIAVFKNNCALSFFKGSYLKNDPMNLLTKPGENSQEGRLIRFTKYEEIEHNVVAISNLINEAKQLILSGKVNKPEKENVIEKPEQLRIIFKNDPSFEKAFNMLTPGRQRAYLIHFKQPKQEATKISRIEKSRTRIMQGLGMHD
jgi:uncharacterized protein YdeI (YjbR/CyaY-like superfamily)